ncbi:hypothetical protein TNCV_3424861 [Trichonephila clavipes]|nr:hypothetical protein TNCV_3424861 [Trichonephila clavipes]
MTFLSSLISNSQIGDDAAAQYRSTINHTIHGPVCKIPTTAGSSQHRTRDITSPLQQPTLPSSRKSSREVGVERKDVGGSRPPTGCSPSKLEWNREKTVRSPVWCSRLRLTSGVQLAPCHEEFRAPESDAIEIRTSLEEKRSFQGTECGCHTAILWNAGGLSCEKFCGLKTMLKREDSEVFENVEARASTGHFEYYRHCDYVIYTQLRSII